MQYSSAIADFYLFYDGSVANIRLSDKEVSVESLRYSGDRY